ncbi:MAG: hypothetical protein MI919_06655, partial [Holophagales bacterium]|nr:hypothetical protein [Holophagales bacterium]
RLRAMRQWLGREGVPRRVATASGVGHFGRDLVIHCLACEAPGAPVENPRQVPAYRYSARYGPEPPCFARATRLDRRGSPPWLLVGGTASVRGEDSLHLGDLEAQLAETLVNLAEVSRVGRECGARRGPAQVGTAEARLEIREPGSAGEGGLAAFRQLRVYHVDRAHRPRIRTYLERHLPSDAEVEYWHADLCRPELLVEIEGLAELRGARSG